MCVCVYACVHVLGSKMKGAYCNPALFDFYSTGKKFGKNKIFKYFQRHLLCSLYLFGQKHSENCNIITV